VARVQQRQTVDLSAYPDLVVIYLGMQAKSLRGLRTLLSYGQRITRSVEAAPDGLLRHQFMMFSLFPPHLGMRQYWRDFDALERWARSEPHRTWWQALLRDPGGTGFWHETYFIRGGIETIFLDVNPPTGLLSFAQAHEARGAMFSARRRLRVQGEEQAPPGLTEEEFYQAR
jgi:hypothetical protein